MKKIICIILLMLIVLSLNALATWNPWLRTWTFNFNDQIHNLRFDHKANVTNLDNGKTYIYDWDMTYLYIFDYNSQDYIFEIEFFNNDIKFKGKEINLGFTIHGYISN